MTRHDWERQLDADPSDTVTRLVFADWLEDHGEPVAAACQRWMVREWKWPNKGYGTYDDEFTTYDWWLAGKAGGLNYQSSEVQPEVFLALAESDDLGFYSCRSYKEFASPRAAVAALQEALLALGCIGEEVRR